MVRVQFANAIKELDDTDMTEAARNTLPSDLHARLRRVLMPLAAPDVLEAFDEMVCRRTTTIADVAVRSLQNGFDQNEKPDAKEHIERYELQKRIVNAEKTLTPLELSSDDQKLIKGSVVKFYRAPSIVGQMLDVIEHGNVPDKPAEAPRPVPFAGLEEGAEEERRTQAA